MAGGASPSQRISVLLGLSVAACIALEVTSEIPGMQRRRWRERRPGIRPGAQDGEAPGVGGSYQAKELPRVQRQCDRPFDCSSGCIAVIGNGWSMTRGQAAMASQCEQVYRANFMDSMNACFTKTSHCFFHWIPNGFVAVRNGVPPQPSTTIGNSNRFGINCQERHTIWEHGYLADRNMSWTGPSETLTKEQVKEIMSPYWDSNELIDNRPAKDLWKKPSSGIYMIAYAMKNRRDRCVHIMGYNFWFKAGSGYKAEHPFQEERRLVQRMLRMERNVFFHPMMPVETWHGKGELLYGV